MIAVIFRRSKKERMKRFLTIRKSSLFYDTYDDDAQILSYLLGYKIIKGRVGFPENAIHKVINALEENKINYKIIGEQEEVKDFKNLNQYSRILASAQDKNILGERLQKIFKKIDSLDSGSLCEVLERIESIIYEYN